VVRVVAVLKHQFTVEVYVKFAMGRWHQFATANGVAILFENLARYPSGS
jgi:hypothetical protein